MSGKRFYMPSKLEKTDLPSLRDRPKSTVCVGIVVGNSLASTFPDFSHTILTGLVLKAADSQLQAP